MQDGNLLQWSKYFDIYTTLYDASMKYIYLINLSVKKLGLGIQFHLSYQSLIIIFILGTLLLLA